MSDGKVIFETGIDKSGFEKDAKKTEYIAKKQGESIGSSLAKGTVDLAKKGLLTLGATVVGTGASIVSMAKNTSETAKEINNMSQKIGISIESYQKWDYIFKKSGTSIDIMQGGMKKLSGAIVEANNGSEEAIAKFNGLGISIDDLKNLTQEEIFEKSIKGLQGMGQSAERTTLATDLFGRSATELGPLLNKTDADMAKLEKNINKYGLVMSEEAVKSSIAFKGSLSSLGTALGATQRQLISELLPGMSQVVNGFTDLVMGVDGADVAIKDGINNVVSGIKTLIPKLGAIISDISETIISVAPDLLKALGEGIMQALPVLIPTITNLVLKLGQLIIEALPMLIDAATQIIVSLVKGIAEAMPQLIGKIVDVIISINSTLIDNIDLLIDASIEIIIALARGLIEALPRLIERIPEIIVKLVAALIRNAPKLLDAAFALMGILGQGLINSIWEVIKWIPQIIDQIAKQFGTSISQMVEIGRNIIYGLWNGIWEKVSWLKDKVTNVIGGVVDGIKNFLGIHSPSTLFAGIGKNMALGLGQGFDSIDLQKNLTATLQASVPSSINNGMGNTYNSTYNESYNFNQPWQSPDQVARAIRMQRTYGLAGERR